MILTFLIIAGVVFVLAVATWVVPPMTATSDVAEPPRLAISQPVVLEASQENRPDRQKAFAAALSLRQFFVDCGYNTEAKALAAITPAILEGEKLECKKSDSTEVSP